jgi:hypothetical protein
LGKKHVVVVHKHNHKHMYKYKLQMIVFVVAKGKILKFTMPILASLNY